MATFRRWRPHANFDLEREIVSDGFQIIQRRNRYHQHSRSSNSIKIEAKSFKMRVLLKPLGRSLQLIECRSHLVRSILIPQAALSWLRQTLDDTSQLQTVVNPTWSRSSNQILLQDLLLSNRRGRFIKVIDTLQDGRSGFASRKGCGSPGHPSSNPIWSATLVTRSLLPY